MNWVLQSRLARSGEWALLIAIVLVAIVFRFAQFGQVPPGLHYDEAIDAHLAQQIRSGQWAIYFEEGWGREPLYHYFVAFTLNFIPDPASALRTVSGLLGLIQLVAAYFLFRELFGVRTALLGAAWMAVLFWTVSTSRAGLRNITLTTFATLTALAFWKWIVAGRQALTQHRPTPVVYSLLAGLLLGLTLYTYQPSRVVPLVFLVFVAYLFFANRSLVIERRRSLGIFFVVAAVVFIPLAVFLATHPEAETGRAFQTEPIRALLKGDLGPALGTAVATLKMFTFEGGGDPQPIYNVSGRPLFIGVGSILFYLGLLACLVRYRQPAYVFILIWLVVALLPNMITEPAPFFYRAIATQTPVSVLPAIGTLALGDWVFHRAGGEKNSLRSAQFISIAVVAAVSLGQTALTTQHDYFEVWGKEPAVRFQYSATHTAIARELDASSETTPVAISGYFAEDADPYIFAQTLHRSDLSIRWFDARDALVVVDSEPVQRIALPSFTPLDAGLQARFLGQAPPVTRTKDFAMYSLDTAAFRSDIETWGGRPQTPEYADAPLPIAFDGNISLLGYEHPASAPRGEAVMTVLTAWRVTSLWQPSPTAIFVHLLDASGNVVTQDDRLGFPRHSWHPGDEFVQVHRVPLAGVPPGRYTLQIGVYTREDGARWTAQDGSGKVIGDRVLIGQVEVQP